MSPSCGSGLRARVAIDASCVYCVRGPTPRSRVITRSYGCTARRAPRRICLESASAEPSVWTRPPRRRLAGYARVDDASTRSRASLGGPRGLLPRVSADPGMRESRTFDTSPAPAYDAIYAIVYAAYAGSHDAAGIFGRAIASGMSRIVPPGDAIDVGPLAIFQAFEALRAGRSIDLRGAATELDFNPKTGDAAFDLDILCVTPRKGTVEEVPRKPHPDLARTTTSRHDDRQSSAEDGLVTHAPRPIVAAQRGRHAAERPRSNEIRDRTGQAHRIDATLVAESSEARVSGPGTRAV